MNAIGKNLKDARKSAGYTQQQVMDIIRNQYSTPLERSMISKWENDKQEPTITYIKLLSIIYNTSMEALAGRKRNTNEHIIELPILAEVAAGYGSYADIQNSAIGIEKIPSDWISDKENYVFLKVKGDSMMPRFEEDDLVLVKCQTSVDSGSYAIAIIDNEAGVVKKVVYGDDWIELQSLNPKYPVRRFEGAEVSRIRIFGLVKKAIRNYN